VLRSEIRRRGLWDLPTRYLGVEGGSSWDEEGGRSQSKDIGALDELVFECYQFVFVTRFDALAAQLKVLPNIDGLVFLNVRHFLHERQSEHDPIGTRTFRVLQLSVLRAVEDGELRVLGGDERIRNETVLAFANAAEGAASAPELAEIVARWNDDLLPDLVTYRGRQQQQVILRLRSHLSGLPHQGIATFRFQELIEPLKADVRVRWAALLEKERGETAVEEKGEVVTVARPSRALEERQRYRELLDCVLRGIAGADLKEKTRGYLGTLFEFFRVQTEEGMNPDRSSRMQRSVAAELEAEDDGGHSNRRLAEDLRIPRERMKELFRILRKLLQDCGAWVGGRFRAES
jgi:hypothetical protein